MANMISDTDLLIDCRNAPVRNDSCGSSFDANNESDNQDFGEEIKIPDDRMVIPNRKQVVN